MIYLGTSSKVPVNPHHWVTKDGGREGVEKLFQKKGKRKIQNVIPFVTFFLLDQSKVIQMNQIFFCILYITMGIYSYGKIAR